MEIDIIFKIAAIGIAIAVLNQVLVKAGREEQAMLTTLAGVIVVLILVMQATNNPAMKRFFGAACKSLTPKRKERAAL